MDSIKLFLLLVLSHPNQCDAAEVVPISADLIEEASVGAISINTAPETTIGAVASPEHILIDSEAPVTTTRGFAPLPTGPINDTGVLPTTAGIMTIPGDVDAPVTTTRGFAPLPTGPIHDTDVLPTTAGIMTIPGDVDVPVTTTRGFAPLPTGPINDSVILQHTILSRDPWNWTGLTISSVDSKSVMTTTRGFAALPTRPINNTEVDVTVTIPIVTYDSVPGMTPATTFNPVVTLTDCSSNTSGVLIKLPTPKKLSLEAEF